MSKFIPRERKHKLRQRLEQNHSKDERDNMDTNEAEILPSKATEKENKRRALKDALIAQQHGMSSKKQKRLDKYIDKKMKKEENVELVKKLANAKIDTSLYRSSRTLGATKVSKRDVLTRALNETKAGINIQSNQKFLFKDQKNETGGSDGDSDQDEEPSVPRKTQANLSKAALGSGLKRSLDTNADGNSIIKKRRHPHHVKALSQPKADVPWEGFDSDIESNSSKKSAKILEHPEKTRTHFEAIAGSSSDDSEADSYSKILTEDDSENAEGDEGRNQRSSAFKAWATSRVNEALGFTPTAEVSTALEDYFPGNKAKFDLRDPEDDPLPPELEVTGDFPDRKAFSVQVLRPPGIQEARLGLPVVAEEQKIMEAIYRHTTIVIWGATGSGKTTQVPQFLYEAGFGSPKGPNPGMIGVTQPRRVAAVSMAKRVGDELGDVQSKVSYQIRFDSTVSSNTAVKFMTDGILIREIANDFALLKYSVIIIDEAHERTANTDILIGMVSRIVGLRDSMSKEAREIKPLKLIIMSATLRITDFLENPNLFRNGRPPLIQAEGRQYPVTTHFSRRTQRDYVEEAFRKVCKGHKKLPPGGMLVFLTGQNEITALSNRLKDALSNVEIEKNKGHKVRITASEAPLETEDLDSGNAESSYRGFEDDEGDEDDDPFDNDEGKEFDIEDTASPCSQVYILPLYSQLQTREQLRVFEPSPENARMIVLATNVAETSLTIPGIRYVFDCGRAKERKYDRVTGVQSFEIGWVSKASASQRAGRAGRTGPGHCYRLYSSAVYERDFEEHASPEILEMPVEGVVLQLKSMDLQHVVNFPFPTPPDLQSLANAEKLLTYLGALSSEGKITNIGRELSNYPLSPRYSKMLTIGHQHGCMPYTIALVAALTTPNIFIPVNHLDLTAPSQLEIYTNEDRLADEACTKRRSSYNHAHYLFSRQSPTSDAIKALTALCAYAHAPSKVDFCKEFYISPKAIFEASGLHSQLASIVHNSNPSLLPATSSLKLPSPSKTQIAALQQFMAAAFIDQIAILASSSPSPPELTRKPTRAIDVPYLPLFPINAKNQHSDMDIIDIAVFLHPSSILAHLPVKELPTYVVYSHLQRATPSTIDGAKKPRTRMHALAAVSGKQLAGLAMGTPLLEYGKPIGKLEEMVNEHGKTRVCWVVPSLVGVKGRTGWPLPAQKVLQGRGWRGEWLVEKIIG